DEADWFEKPADLGKLLNAVKPTVDAGGQLILLSSPDKKDPESLFKRIYRAARAGTSKKYHPIFLPWSARPERTQERYNEERASGGGGPATQDERGRGPRAPGAGARARRAWKKRTPPAGPQQCYVGAQPPYMGGGDERPPAGPAVTIIPRNHT